MCYEDTRLLKTWDYKQVRNIFYSKNLHIRFDEIKFCLISQCFIRFLPVNHHLTPKSNSLIDFMLYPTKQVIQRVRLNWLNPPTIILLRCDMTTDEMTSNSKIFESLAKVVRVLLCISFVYTIFVCYQTLGLFSKRESWIMAWALPRQHAIDIRIHYTMGNTITGKLHCNAPSALEHFKNSFWSHV